VVRVTAAKREKLDRASASYRRKYDRLYVQSMKAGSVEECARINAALARINAEYEAAKAEAAS
jgi:multidrug resistance efflux pump